MAKMSNSLVKQFAKTITQSVPQEKSKSSNALGTLVKEGNIFYAMLDGSTFLTPVSMSMSGEEGDRVLVTIQNHSAIVTANITAPAATTKYVERVEADLTTFKDVTVKNMLAGYIRTDELEAKVGTLGYLKVTDADVTYLKAAELEAKVGTFGYLKTNQLESEVAKFGYLKTGELAADVANLGYLKVTEAEATYLKVDELEGKVATFGYLKVGELEGAVGKFGYLTADQASLKYAQIDFANVTGQVVGTSLIKDGAITDAKILGLSANKITAGILDAAKITVTNLNADNITVGTLNGKLIGTGSVDLNKLAEEVPTKEYLDSVQNELQDQIDKSIQTYTVTAVPLLNNEPAQDWAAEEYPKHVGDVCYVVNPGGQADGYTYRFEKDGSTYGWSLIKDSQVIEALQKLLNVDGDLSGLKSFQSETSSWITKTDSELSSVKSRTTTIETTYSTKAEAQNLVSDAKKDLENALSTKVETTTFNEVKQTVDTNSAQITQMTKTLEQKADGSTVESLQQTVNTVQQTANENVSKISQVSQSVGRAQSTADDANSKIDGLEIGGRNLALNSADLTKWSIESGMKIEKEGDWFKVTSTSRTSERWGIYLDVPVEKNTVYTFSVYGKTGSVDAYCGGGPITNNFGQYWGPIPSESRIVETLSTADKTVWRIYLDICPKAAGHYAYFKLPKLEKGTKATDWTPAPEDMATQESVEKVSSTVNEVKQTADSNSAKITQMNQTIAQKADGSKVSALEERTSSVEQNLSGFKSEVSSTYTTKTEFENLEIGGRNLALNSADLTKWSIESGMKIEKEGDWFKLTNVSQKNNSRYGIYIDVPIEKNTAHTFAVTMKPGNVNPSFGGGPGTSWGNDYKSSDKEGRLVQVVPSSSTNTNWRIYLYLKGSTVGQYAYFKLPKLEKGTKATDWTPAPEDMVDKSTYESYVTQTDSKIAAKLESSTFNSFQNGDYSNFKKSTNEFIGTSEAWEMKWNKIFNGTNAAEDTYQSYITFQNGEQILGNSKSSIKLHLKNDTIQFEDSNGNSLASFEATNIYLGKNSKESIIDLCNGSGKIAGYTSDYGDVGIELSGPHYVNLFTEGVEIDSNCANKSSALLMGDEFLEMFLNDGSGGWSSKISLEGTTIKLLGDQIVALSSVIKVGLTEYREDRIELYGPWPYIDFHYGNSTADYTSRIFENSSGNLWINGVDFRGNTLYSSNWFRSTGNSGWYNETYGGGIYMCDSSDVRIFGGKNFSCDNEIYAAGTVSAGYWGNTGAERQVRVIAGAGTMYMYSQGNSGGNMGIFAAGRCAVLTLGSDNWVYFEQPVRFNGGVRICGNGGHDSQVTMSSGGNWVSLNRAGNDGSFHGNLGSGTNYWNTVNYKNLNKVSDRRKKRDLGKLSLDETLLLLNNIQTVKYSMIDESEDAVQYGVFAQDIRDMLRINNLGYRSMLNISFIDGSEQMTTNLYASEDSVTYGVDYIQFIAPLIKGWQYHNSELSTLKRDYQVLRGQYQSLQGQIEALRNKLYELEMAM